MKTLTVEKAHDLSKLHDELLAVFPEWIEAEDGEARALHALTGDGASLTLIFPDATAEADVLAVIDAHDPTPPQPTVLDYDAFEARFTEAERDGMTNFIYATDAGGIPAQPKMIQEFTRAVARGAIDLESPKTAVFMDALVAGGALTQARRDEILTP